MAFGIGFKQVGYIDKGHRYAYGRINAYDTNHDGYKELIFFVNEGVGEPKYIIDYEYRPVNNYTMIDTLNYNQFRYSFDVNETDNDTYTDLNMESDTTSVLESIDYNNYPKQRVWNANIILPMSHMYFTDLDRDYKKEIFTIKGDLESLFVFENNGNNIYDLVWTNNVSSIDQNITSFAIGDFDGDSLTEFVTGTSGGKMILWECTGDNQYQSFGLIVLWHTICGTTSR